MNAWLSAWGGMGLGFLSSGFMGSGFDFGLQAQALY